MKTANIRKSMSLYLPEHVMSTVKDKGVLFGCVMVIVGFPYAVEISAAYPNRFSMAHEACVLIVDRVEPRA